MAERLKAAVLKTVVGKPTGGSNPSLSAKLFPPEKIATIFHSQHHHFQTTPITDMPIAPKSKADNLCRLDVARRLQRDLTAARPHHQPYGNTDPQK